MEERRGRTWLANSRGRPSGGRPSAGPAYRGPVYPEIVVRPKQDYGYDLGDVSVTLEVGEFL